MFNVFPKMFPRTYHTLFHNLGPKVQYLIELSQRAAHLSFCAKVFHWGRGCSNFKVSKRFEIIWDAPHNYLKELTISEPQVLVPMKVGCINWYFTLYNEP
jgi:hypothetical protein